MNIVVQWLIVRLRVDELIVNYNYYLYCMQYSKQGMSEGRVSK